MTVDDPRLRRQQRRAIYPVLAILAAMVFAGLAVWAGADSGAAKASGAAVDGPVTPVFSPRRIGAYLAAPIGDAKLRAGLDQVVANSPQSTCLTVSLGGRVVYEHNPELDLTPASNEKLVTATAAIEVLGAATRMRTSVVATGGLKGTVVDGDLYLVGGGDPLLSTNQYAAHFEHQPQIRTSMESFARAIVKAGVEHIAGRIVGDDSRYDKERYPAIWPGRFRDQNQSGPLSGLAVNDGFEEYPPNQSPGASEEVPAADPAAHAARALTDLLAAEGVQVDGAPTSGKAPAAAKEVAHIDSPPMRDIVRELLDESDNQTAELLVKEMGRKVSGQPTTNAGVKVVTDTMQRLGLAAAGTKTVDGSGLAEEDKTSCRLLMGVLDRGGRSGLIAKSLAVAGKSGTLSKRFLNSKAKGRLRAKTGTLNTVTALTGFVDATQGPVLTFAYIANGQTVSDALLGLQEALGDDLVVYPQGPPLAALAPKPVD